MPKPVYRVLELLCGVVGGLPIGTNLGLLHRLWMLLSGRLLETRGAVIPGLSATGLEPAAVRRAWAALGQGRWTSAALLARWLGLVRQEGRWTAAVHGGYRPVAVDRTGFWRPRLRGCPTTHDASRVGKALPAIPVGIVARIGAVGTQRLGLPLALVRADPADPRTAAHSRALARAAVALLEQTEVLVVDGGFGVRLLQEAGATRYVAREAKNCTARRATLPPASGRGAPRQRGALVRPLARTYRGRTIPATAPDRVECWQEAGVALRAEWWEGLVRPDGRPGDPTYRIVALWDPRWAEPLLLASPLAVAARTLRDLYADRWPVEQLPLVAKQLLGTARQFVSEPETCQRLPELALLAGSVLSYAAATQPALPTGFWDRRPRPTAGRLRRALARAGVSADLPLPARLRTKASRTSHLQTGYWGQRRARTAPTPPTPPLVHPHPAETAA